MGKTKRLTQVRAGRMVKAVIYTQPCASDEPKARAAKSKVSSAARERLNRRQSWMQLEVLLAANFEHDDLFVTLTYADAPEKREAAQKCCCAFIRLLSAARKARGEELRYVKNCEHLRDDGSEGRWHHHIVINRTEAGGDFEEIRSLWSAWGENVDIQPLLSPGESCEARARYLAKERPPLGKNSWTPSRNLVRPVKTSELVDDALTLSAPPGAVILESDRQSNGWGEFVYIKYLLPYKPKKKKKETGRVPISVLG